MKEYLTADKLYNENEIANGSAILTKYAGTVANNNYLFKEGYNATYDKDYSYLSLKRSRLLQCDCKNAKFVAAAMTGSDFQYTNFEECDFSNACLDYCLFFQCHFSDLNGSFPIKNATMGNSTFVDCTLDNITIDKSTVSNALFENVIWNSCAIEYSAFENTTFLNCSFKNMEFRNLNLEFVEFAYPAFQNVTLPFAQVPYTFGLLESIKECPHEVWITSRDNERIPVDEYFQLLSQILPYYISEQEYFPVANIYIALGEYENAFSAIKNGIQKASFKKDFRMLKYFCKLAILNQWCSRDKILQLYNTINDINRFEPLSDFQRHNYFLQLGDFRKILLFGNEEAPTLHCQLKTNILPDESEKIAVLIDGINQVVSSVDTSSIIHAVELRHESPYEIMVTAIAALAFLQLLSQGIHCLCTPIKEVQELVLKQQEIKLKEQELALNKKQLEQVTNDSEKVKETLITQQIFLYGNCYITQAKQKKSKKK